MSGRMSLRRRHIARLAAEQGGLCHWCREPMDLGPHPASGPVPPRTATIDHLASAATGRRTDDLFNLVAACHGCNRARNESEMRRLNDARRRTRQGARP